MAKAREKLRKLCGRRRGFLPISELIADVNGYPRLKLAHTSDTMMA